MEYLSTFEVAKKWGITPRRVLSLIKSGRIPEAKYVSSRWMIPETTEKPTDGRTKTAKEETEKAYCFRYPIFEHMDISAFNPPLTNEELIIKNAVEAFYACHFQESDKILGNLPETAKNRYIRIYALRIGCAVDIFLCNSHRFFQRYSRLSAELQGDFPYKTEMQECMHELDATLGKSEYYIRRFKIIPGYPYHKSFLPHLTSLNALSFAFATGNISPKEVETQEISCIYLERENALADLQSMHIYLGCAYTFLNMPEEMNFHFKKALLLAEKYDLFYAPALQYFYMRKPMSQALQSFSDYFKKKLTNFSVEIHKRYLAFTEKTAMNTIYRTLSGDDYIFLYYAVQGYTNNEIAKQLHLSVGTVGKRYGKIYDVLGVNSKQEMIALYNSMLGSKQ